MPFDFVHPNCQPNITLLYYRYICIIFFPPSPLSIPTTLNSSSINPTNLEINASSPLLFFQKSQHIRISPSHFSSFFLLALFFHLKSVNMFHYISSNNTEPYGPKYCQVPRHINSIVHVLGSQTFVSLQPKKLKVDVQQRSKFEGVTPFYLERVNVKKC